MQLCKFWGSIVITQVVLSVTVMLVDLSVAIMHVTVSDRRKTFKGIISGFRFTTFVNILPKLRYFEGRNSNIQIC